MQEAEGFDVVASVVVAVAAVVYVAAVAAADDDVNVAYSEYVVDGYYAVVDVDVADDVDVAAASCFH